MEKFAPKVYNFPQEGENDEYPVADNEPPGFHGAS
jgi:hypothetical protein